VSVASPPPVVAATVAPPPPAVAATVAPPAPTAAPSDTPPSVAAPSSPPDPEPAPVAETPAPAAATPATHAGIPSGMGRILTSDAAPGRRVYVDGHVVGQTPRPILVKCGAASVKVGSSGRAHSIDVPCGGEIRVGKR
jgi:hypothetical protein